MSKPPLVHVKSVLQNGIGRHVGQLQRLTLKFCKSYAGSKGVRDFIENDLMDFTRRNPGVVVYLHPRRHRGASLVAEYLNGSDEHISVNNLNSSEVCQWAEHLRTHSGNKAGRLMKTWHTDSPSIQGIWTPFTNKPSAQNVTPFPNLELSACDSEPTATQKLLDLAKQLQTQKNVAQVSEKH